MTIADVQVSRASSSEHEPAFRLLFTHLSPGQQQAQIALSKDEAHAGRISLDGIFVARRASQIVGAIWCHVLPGRTATIWPPRLIAGEGIETAEELCRQINKYMSACTVRLAQCLADTDCGPDADLLRAAGFVHAAELLYMVSSQDAFPEIPSCGGLEFEPYGHSQRRRLAKLVESTYRDTLDCPALDTARDMEDVLDGYQATGDYDPSRWFFLRHGTEDIGCLLLADRERDGQWELVYMGIVPEARGSGWGLEATRHAQWLTRQSDRSRLVLAVDAGNHPALRIYAMAGFSAWDRRSVFVKTIG